MQKSIEDETARIYGLYEKKSRSFRTAFYSLSGLVLIFFGLVFYPYVSTLGEKSQIDRRLAALDRTIKETAALVADHETIMRELLEHHAQVDSRTRPVWFGLEQAARDQDAKLHDWRARLRDDPDAAEWARGVKALPVLSPEFLRRHPDFREARDKPCFWLAQDAWLRCEVATRLEALHEFATRPLRYRRAPPFVRMELLPPLAAQLDALQRSFRERWLGNAPAWQAAPSDGTSLQQGLSAFLADYAQAFTVRAYQIGGRRSDLDSARRAAERERAPLEIAQARAEKRLDQVKAFRNVETPIGQLPVGLDELVLIFPVLLAAGFLSCASLLADTLRLRGAFHRFARELDQERTLFTDDHVALVAPLWLDPLAGRWSRAATLAILAIPALVFLAAIALLFLNRLLLGDFPDTARLSPPVYMILYALCGALIAEAFRRVAREVRRYRRDLMAAQGG